VARTSVFGGTAIASRAEPAYHAIDVRTPHAPSVQWQAYSAPTYAASAVANGVVFTGALDDLPRAYDAETGACSGLRRWIHAFRLALAASRSPQG
jgi:hypothetical protein